MTQTSSADTAAIKDAVIAAATAAAAQLPSGTTLTVGEPLGANEDAIPEGATTAVCARLSGEVTGDVVIVISAEVVEALGSFPAGGMDVASALRPALEAGAATMGNVRVSAERTEDALSAMDGLKDKGVYLAVPLTNGAEHVATFALQVSTPTARPRRGSLELLRNVSMEVTVEIGRTKMTVHELLSLHPGEVVELDRAAGSPADLLVNGTLVARGEVVVVDEDFGLRITQIVTDVNVADLSS
ncbi:flagellar motor switch protein FliN [Tessaracoccus sp.]